MFRKKGGGGNILKAYIRRIFSRINQIVERFPESKFGSYPSWVNQYYKTRISFECPTLQELGKSHYICAHHLSC
jgi:hypothetical protein